MASLIPLYLMYRLWFGGQKLEEFRGGESKTRSIILPVAIFALSILALPSTGILFLVVLTILAERYVTSSFGFRADRFARNLLLGILLYSVVSLIPLFFGYAGSIFNYPFRAVSLRKFDPTAVILAFPYATLVIGLAEEALFRGYMQTKFSSFMGPWKAVLLQATLFGLAHLSPGSANLEFQIARVIMTFLGGLLTGAFFRYTRNLTGIVFLHGLVDSVFLGFRPSSVSFIPISWLTIFAQIASGKLIQVTMTVGREPSLAMSIFAVGAALFSCAFARRICTALGTLDVRPLGSFRLPKGAQQQ